MIQDKILDNQVGIGYQGEKDLSEVPLNRLLNTGVLLGKFKRGFVGKPFVVTANNFKRLLGYDPNNNDYKAVEDFFSGGGQRLVIVRLGEPNQKLVTTPPNKPTSTSPTPSIGTISPSPGATPPTSATTSYITISG